jgi:lipopolysaccharide transport system ATP-binding protein
MSIAIKVENISKAYQLGQIGTGTISRDLERWIAKLRGKEDPFLKIGEENDRTTVSKSNVVWSLKDINFEIQQGDAVGVIGRNGAGKSTLLKLLSRVTSPTTGIIKARGRIASLLEVGTGFHPELTGRENIYLNGAILGMRKKEIDKKFDEIVDFSGVERYIDTPVKRYSSGMYVRLAFAVAAHLDSEILIVDEVLAVGDAEFQKKCLGKMGDLSKGQGRTVLFVSHNMNSIEALCNKGLLLSNGHILKTAPIKEVIENYISIKMVSEVYEGTGIIKSARILTTEPVLFKKTNFCFEVVFNSEIDIYNIILGFVIKDEFGNNVIGVNNKHYQSEKLNNSFIKSGKIKIVIDRISLLPGNYIIDLFLGDSNSDLQAIENALKFTIQNTKILNSSAALDFRLNKLHIENINWSLESYEENN